jgi:hypothetical protein
MTEELIHFIFSHHPPKNDQGEKYEQVNSAFIELALKVNALMPDGPGKTAAIRQLNVARNAVNSAIALEGRF